MVPRDTYSCNICGSGQSCDRVDLRTPFSRTKTPIFYFYIISASFLGYALKDYKKKGDEELDDLFKDDVLGVYYNRS